MPRMFVESEGGVGFEREGRRRREEVCRLLEERISRSCQFACVAFGVHRYMFGRVLNRGFVNPRVQCRRDSLHETLLNSSDRSEGSQRAPRGGESLVVRVDVDGYRSILDAYDAGREAETERPRLFLTLQIDLKVPSGHHVKVRVLSSALTAVVASLTRTTPVERPRPRGRDSSWLFRQI
jgi:hypothetical protein